MGKPACSGGRHKKELITTKNTKYEITEIAHEKYPFLHRIRALRDIGSEVKTGDLGGFVESESNLSDEEDVSWIFDDAIAAGDAYVDQDALLRGDAIACDRAYISQGAVLSGHARAEDDAYIRSAVLNAHARVSGSSMVLNSQDGLSVPILSGHCAVYGKVLGDVRLTGSALVFSGEEICNTTQDTLIINGQDRTIVRAASRDELTPRRRPQQKEKTRPRGMER